MKHEKNKLSMAVLMAMVSSFILSVNAETQTDDEIINNSGPGIELNDTDANETDWEICIDDGCAEVSNESKEGFHIVSKITGSPDVMTRVMTIQDNARTDALRLDGEKIGMGTATPQSNLHIYAPPYFNPGFPPTLEPGFADIRLEGAAGGIWDISASTHFSLSATHLPEDSFRVDGETGDVGIGLSSPTSTLHVQKAGVTFAVEDISPTVAVRNVVKLSNNGSVGFELEDTSLSNSWDFRTAANGGFLVSNIGSPGSKLQINQDGAVFLNGAKFYLNAAGNMTIAGTSTATSHISSSSRAVKKDFAEVDVDEVMTKIKGLEVTQWRYKDENAEGRHIGPMAEDFYALFGLGPDDKHVAATDMAGIAIIAAKELQAENSQLKAQLEKQGERLSSLEKLVTNLAARESVLPKTGFNLVLAK